LPTTTKEIYEVSVVIVEELGISRRGFVVKRFSVYIHGCIKYKEKLAIKY